MAFYTGFSILPSRHFYHDLADRDGPTLDLWPRRFGRRAHIGSDLSHHIVQHFILATTPRLAANVGSATGINDPVTTAENSKIFCVTKYNHWYNQ